ncbi:interferon gamma receptor 1 [Protobothrops mucrosquamatus]|uniref:interferon gamma receptor 1 n=1 Tax=Protobothrops mucrosquamatus TaxID=103944 RepID=UPI000775E3D6|nr:interferon gamma receptor 1 [Protobothrops mucrosquamatus]
MRVVGPWLVLALLGWSHCSGFNAREPQTEVPSPKNVTVKLYNDNISVYWDYGSPSLKPLFTVQIKCYGTGVYKEIDTCINIKQHYCDLTNKTDNCETFWVGVKAVSGQHQSEYVEQKFDILRDGRIGPPKFNLSIDNQDIVVNIEPPLFPYGDLIEEFTYKLFIWKRENPEERQEIISEDWYLDSSTLPLSVSLDTSYCISIQVFSPTLTKVGEESEEKCISPTPKSRLGFTLFLCFGIIALVTLAIILVVVFIKCRERRITLPKSLVAVVRNQVSNAEFKSECKYDTITSTSYKPMVTCEDEKPVEKLDVAEKVNIADPNYSKEVDIDDSQGIQRARSIQEDMAVEISENEQIHEDNVTDYSKSITGQDTCPDLQNPDLPRADVQKPTVLRCSIKPSGYDKPHWVDLSSGEEF